MTSAKTQFATEIIYSVLTKYVIETINVLISHYSISETFLINLKSIRYYLGIFILFEPRMMKEIHHIQTMMTSIFHGIF